MSWVLRGGAASLVAGGAALLVGTASALAYQSGTIGYDISFPQCGTTYPTSTGPIRSPIPPAVPTAPLQMRSAVSVSAPAVLPQSNPPVRIRSFAPKLSRFSRGFGIVGVDSGYPFITSAHGGNPCLADEYAHTPNAALYVNTGYDPSYTSSTYTTADCTTKSAGVAGTSSQKAAWAVGCSEAEKDLAYVASQGIISSLGWWLDVELANSWCGQHGVTCDLSLNQYSIQGLIDTLLGNRATPVGIYSTKYQWSAIVGTNTVHGQTADWYATATSTAQAAAPYCSSTYSFTGNPVELVQFGTSTVDYDYAC